MERSYQRDADAALFYKCLTTKYTQFADYQHARSMMGDIDGIYTEKDEAQFGVTRGRLENARTLQECEAIQVKDATCHYTATGINCDL